MLTHLLIRQPIWNMEIVVYGKEEELRSPMIVGGDIVMGFFNKLYVRKQGTVGKLVVNRTANEETIRNNRSLSEGIP